MNKYVEEVDEKDDKTEVMEGEGMEKSDESQDE